MHSQTQSGITLLELMIVVAIIGLLASIAYPSYRQTMIRANRTEAKVALENRAQALEKCFTRYLAYDNPNCVAAHATSDGPTQPKGAYQVTAVTVTPTTYTLRATPVDAQAEDSECGTFQIDHTGLRTVTGSRPPEQCW
jgi:type IV pilus assembly protein PilE